MKRHRVSRERELFRPPVQRPGWRHGVLLSLWVAGLLFSGLLWFVIIMQLEYVFALPAAEKGPAIVLLWLIGVHLTLLHLLHTEIVREHRDLFDRHRFQRSLTPLRTNKQFGQAVAAALALLSVFAFFLFPSDTILSWLTPAVMVFNFLNYGVSLRWYRASQRTEHRYH